MNYRPNKLQLPGMAGLLFVLLNTVALLLDFVVSSTTGGDTFFNLANIGPDLLGIQGSTAWSVGAILRVVQIVPLVLFVPGLYWVFRGENDRGFAAHGALGVFLYWLFATFQNAATVAVVELLAPAYTAGSQAAQSIEVAATALLGFGAVFFHPGGGLATLFLVVGIALLGYLTMRTNRLPRWTGYVALGSALFSLLGYLQYLMPAFFVAGVLGLGLFVIWTIGVSFSFIRRPATASASEPAGQMALR